MVPKPMGQGRWLDMVPVESSNFVVAVGIVILTVKGKCHEVLVYILTITCIHLCPYTCNCPDVI